MPFYHLQIWPELYGNKYASCSHLSPTYMRHGWHVMFGSDCCDSEDYNMYVCICVRKWGVWGTTDLMETLLQPGLTPPFQTNTWDAQHVHLHAHTHICRWTETNRKTGGKRITDLPLRFYLWSLSQQANCITNTPIIQREKKRCWEREREMDIKRGMQLVPVGDK